MGVMGSSFNNNQPIYIHDIEKDIYTNLRANNYEINLDQGQYENRFEITFATQAQLLGIYDEENNSLDILYSNDKSKLIEMKISVYTKKQHFLGLVVL